MASKCDGRWRQAGGKSLSLFHSSGCACHLVCIISGKYFIQINGPFSLSLIFDICKSIYVIKVEKRFICSQAYTHAVIRILLLTFYNLCAIETVSVFERERERERSTTAVPSPQLYFFPLDSVLNPPSFLEKKIDKSVCCTNVRVCFTF